MMSRNRQSLQHARWVLAALLVVIFFAAAPLPLARADGPTREYQVKAAFVTKFIPFIEWPADTFKQPNDPVVIAVVNDSMGHDPFDNALDQFAAGKTYNGHPLTVKHLDPDADLKACHVLFIPASQDAKLAIILKAVEKHSVLTVGETDAFPRAGGAVRFYLEDNKVRFEASTDALKAANLTASSKLLALARPLKK
jgi:hypothetical protein